MHNYKNLLKKYISHVKECEGASFIPYDTLDRIRFSSILFNGEELEELQRLEDELCKKNNVQTNN